MRQRDISQFGRIALPLRRAQQCTSRRGASRVSRSLSRTSAMRRRRVATPRSRQLAPRPTCGDTVCSRSECRQRGGSTGRSRARSTPRGPSSRRTAQAPRCPRSRRLPGWRATRHVSSPGSNHEFPSQSLRCLARAHSRPGPHSSHRTFRLIFGRRQGHVGGRELGSTVASTAFLARGSRLHGAVLLPPTASTATRGARRDPHGRRASPRPSSPETGRVPRRRPSPRGVMPAPPDRRRHL